MNLLLSQEVQKLIDERVKSGKYAMPEDVVAAALITLEQQEQVGVFEPGELDELLAEGERSLEHDGPLDGDQALQQRRARRAQRRNPCP